MKVSFTKMHGVSNDFILVDEWNHEIIPEDKKPDFVAKFSDRNTGIGADGVIFLQKSELYDAKFVLYNPYGTLTNICGNAIRCLAKYIYDSGHITKTNANVETSEGVKKVDLTLFNDKVERVSVDMGTPLLFRSELGISGNPRDTFINQEIIIDGLRYKITSVRIGDPHVISFVEDISKLNVSVLGHKIRNLSDIFSKGVNVHFVQAKGKNEFEIRSYKYSVEHETLSSGTGACALAVAAVLNEKADPKKTFRFHTRGGELNVELELNENDEIVRVFLIGPIVEVFRGELEYTPSEKLEKAAYRLIGDVLRH